MTAPKIEYGVLGPVLIVLAAAVVAVLVEAFLSRRYRYVLQSSLSFAAIALGFLAVILNRNVSGLFAEGAVAVDGVTVVLQGTILIFALLGLLLIAERGFQSFTAQASALPGSADEQRALASGLQQTEVFPLTLFAVGGALLFPAANDLITLFVALEVLSLPLYLMAGLSQRRRLLSQEAGLKYFLLGAFSSAFFLFGSAFLYGYAGTTTFEGIKSAIKTSAGNDLYLLIGLSMLAVGLLFKVSAAPFHSWTPDVYQGAPTPVTAFMAAVTKVAAFGAFLRIFYSAMGGLVWTWRPIIVAISILTMAIGTIIAIAQKDVKRVLAYSAIAHSGFLLTYLATYGFTTIGTFAVVTLVRDAGGEVTDLNRWSGLGKRSPLVAGIFTLFLLALAGIPLTSGFVGKFAIFSAAYKSGNISVVIAGVLASAVAAFFYIRIVVLMYFNDPQEDGTSVVIPSPVTAIAIGICAVATLVLGIFPQPAINAINSLATFVAG
ncbi:MAG: NADH-quinone oxidoreductase subunit NuoN [Actinobacteria bacterium]|uniref:NADH-quinone oxidoreductase subunit N n=1 Tax=Candidatus Fonsibacter lacus TaxID=2576439 RepID=A0A965LKT8_9PROT|nr:NADH-quinone oxidoreductase subunit NuoN [Candidatus Fonsibacter lacus]